VPLFTALRGHWGTAFRVIAMGAGHRVGTFCIQAYFVTALIQQGFGASLSMFASILLYLIGAPAALLGGVLSDRFGGRRVLVTGFALYALLTVPLFSVLGLSVPLTLLALVICAIINNIVAAPLSNAYIMSFPRAVRGRRRRSTSTLARRSSAPRHLWSRPGSRRAQALRSPLAGT
jgi:MHS family proline/betaine transporter-like MFS transporter